MIDLIINIRGTEYRCISNYNTDNNLSNVDVYLNETYWDRANSSYLGEIEDLEMPDLDNYDDKEMEVFTDHVEDWLNGK